MAWLTGGIPATGDFICRKLFIPNEQSIIIAVNGALSELGKADNWEQFGSLSPDDASQLMLTMVLDFYRDDCEGSGVVELNEIKTFIWNDGDSIPTDWTAVAGASIDTVANRINSSSVGRISLNAYNTLDAPRLILAFRVTLSAAGFTTVRQIAYEGTTVVENRLRSVDGTSDVIEAYLNEARRGDGINIDLFGGASIQRYVERLELFYWEMP